jgi:hypothetical protein
MKLEAATIASAGLRGLLVGLGLSAVYGVGTGSAFGIWMNLARPENFGPNSAIIPLALLTASYTIPFGGILGTLIGALLGVQGRYSVLLASATGALLVLAIGIVLLGRGLVDLWQGAPLLFVLIVAQGQAVGVGVALAGPPRATLLSIRP